MNVLDASVAMRWVIPSPLSARAIQLRDEYLSKVHDLLSPDIFPAEVANALTKAERQKLIKLGDAAGLFATIGRAYPALQSHIPLSGRAIDISSQTRSAFYDCLYVALAEREGCEMVTADDRLVRNLQHLFPFIIHLS